MKTTCWCAIASLIVVTKFSDLHAATITYTYDAQHRLVQSSYGASNKVFYAYDAAGNVDQQSPSRTPSTCSPGCGISP